MDKIQEIRKQLKELAKVEELSDDSKLTEIGLDSLDIVELLLKLEEDYSIHFDDVDMSNFVTVGDLLSNIEKQLNK